MSMFSFNKSSYENRLLQSLQDKFFQTAKRNKALAKWIAGRLGYNQEETNKYIKTLVLSYLVFPSDSRLINRILTDFKNAEAMVSESEIKEKMKSIEVRISSKQKEES